MDAICMWVIREKGFFNRNLCIILNIVAFVFIVDCIFLFNRYYKLK
jgi:hypothetical protein